LKRSDQSDLLKACIIRLKVPSIKASSLY